MKKRHPPQINNSLTDTEFKNLVIKILTELRKEYQYKCKSFKHGTRSYKPIKINNSITEIKNTLEAIAN